MATELGVRAMDSISMAVELLSTDEVLVLMTMDSSSKAMELRSKAKHRVCLFFFSINLETKVQKKFKAF